MALSEEWVAVINPLPGDSCRPDVVHRIEGEVSTALKKTAILFSGEVDIPSSDMKQGMRYLTTQRTYPPRHTGHLADSLVRKQCRSPEIMIQYSESGWRCPCAMKQEISGVGLVETWCQFARNSLFQNYQFQTSRYGGRSSQKAIPRLGNPYFWSATGPQAWHIDSLRDANAANVSGPGL